MHEVIQNQFDDAEAALARLERARAQEREAAMATLRRLDADLKPLRATCAKLGDELAGLRARTIGPWEVSRTGRWADGVLHVHGRPREWYTRRVWLRVACRERRAPEWQWEVQIDQPGGGRIDLVLGPPTDDPAADFAAHQRAVEAKCIELGYFVVSGEVTT